MKLKEKIDKEIVMLVMESLVITIIIVWLAILIGKWVLNNQRDVYVDNEVVVDIDSKIKKELSKVSDIEGLDLKSN